MYNRDRKKCFIEEVYSDSVQKYAWSIMEQIGRQEQLLHCDYADMAQEDADRIIAQLGNASNSSIAHSRSVARAYLKWCQGNQIQTNNVVRKVKADVVEVIRESYVGSPSHLRRTLDFLLPVGQDSTLMYIRRAYLWLAFMGLNESEAFRVMPNHLDFNEMKLTLEKSSWRIYPIYAESVRDLQMACNLTEFAERTRSANATRIRTRVDGDHILRRTVYYEDMVTEIKDFRVSLSKQLKKQRVVAQGAPYPQDGISLQISFGTLQRSGLFYRMYEDERTGITPNFEKHIEIDIARFLRNSDPHPTDQMITKKRVTIRHEYLQCYSRWKEAFSAR